MVWFIATLSSILLRIVFLILLIVSKGPVIMLLGADMKL